MLTDFLSAERTWVIAKTSEDDFPVGALVDFVINPDSGVFEALWIRTQDGLRLLPLDDLIQWTRDKIIIRDENDLMLPSNFPRIKKILEREVPIRNAKVFCDNNFIGRVKNFGFDTLSPKILTLLVHSGFLFWSHERIIPRNKILRIDEKGIFISGNEIKKTDEKILEKNIILPEVNRP